ncbi:MAG: 5S rRNA maturation endonuclease (ribonuclease M5) [Bacteriovoracaceae bacterium]|jgi:5S rRNA maturation endonuclease (ribonuclease M5)
MVMTFSNEEIILRTSAKEVGPNQYQACCPAHNDKSPSLSINTSGDVPVLYCHAGCSYEDIAKHLKDEVYKEPKTTIKPIFNIESLAGKRINSHTLITTYYNKRGIKNFVAENTKLYLREIDSENFAIEIPSYSYLNQENQVGAHLIFISKEGFNIKDFKGRHKKLSYGEITKSQSTFGRQSNSEVLHLSEGNEDAAIISSIIDEPVIPRFGTAGLSNFLPNKRIKTIIIWADNDEAGQRAAKLAKVKYEETSKYKVYILTPNNKKDWLEQEISSKESISTAYSNYLFKAWKKPKIIAHRLPRVRRIASEECHPLIYDFAMEEAAISQTHPDMYIASALVSIGSFTARCFNIQPINQNPYYIESSNIWGLIVAPPGSKKSTASKKGCFGIIGEINKQLMELEKKGVSERRQVQKDLKLLNSRMGSLKKLKEYNVEEYEKVKSEANELEVNLEKVPLRYRTLIVNDITSGALIKRLSLTNENVLFYQDELSGLLGSFNNSFKSDLRPILLQAWNGTEDYYKETKQDGVEFIKRLSLSILGSIQPSKITPLLSEVLHGLNDDGFLQRFQFVVFPDFDELIPSNGIYNKEYLLKLENIMNLVFNYYESIEAPQTIKISREARKYYDLITQIKPNNSYDTQEYEILFSFLAKMPKLFVSLALIFEILDNYRELSSLKEVSHDSAKTAYNLCLKLIQYLEKLLYKQLNPNKTLSHILIEKIDAGLIRDRMTIREINRKGWKGLKHPQEVLNGLSELELQDWIKIKEVTPASGYGRKSEIVEINPHLIKHGINNYIGS